MSLEQNPNNHHRTVVDKFTDPTADYSMKNYDYVLRPKPGAAGDKNITITLPPVSECTGRWYSIMARGVSGGTVIVANQDDSEAWVGDITLNSTGDRILAFSDGLAWLVFFGDNNAVS